MPFWHPPAPPLQVAPAIGASPNTGLSPGITYASPNTPFYGLGSQYVLPSTISVSTLNTYQANVSGSIDLDGNILTTASGVGAELLLNGIPIATTSNLSSIQDWAKFPAVSTINANSNLLIDVSSIKGITGQTLPILASNVEFGGLGQLTGISTINGAPPGSGNAANWATYSAVQDVNMNSQNLNSANQLNLNTGGNVVMLTAGTGNNLLINGTPVGGGGGAVSTIAGSNTFMTATGTSGTATSQITAGGGLGGFITATANPGTAGVSGGNITLTANGGTAPAGLFGKIDIIANEGVSDPGTGAITTGGYVNIVANSGGALANLTSRIDLNAGGLNMYAGITTPITSVFGYGFINALTGLSLVAGSFSSAFQVPGTVYLYGLSGIVLGSDTYATKIYPYWNGLTAPPNLELNGRTTVSGVARVNINNANNISFDAGGSGSISGVQTINGSAYPPPASSIPPNINFSTITIGTGGTIIFSDNTGYIETTAIYGRGDDSLLLDAALNRTLNLSGGAPSGVAQSLITLETDGTVVINNDNTATVPITDGAGLIISAEGQRITFPKDASTGTLAIGEIVGLSTINGSAYPPVGTYTPDPSFSTITIASAGNITFSGSGGDIVGVNNLAINTDLHLGATTTISLSGLFGSPGDVIGIPIGGTYPKWITPSGGSYPSVASFSTINMNPTGYIYSHSIEHPASDAGDMTINQANNSGGLYITVGSLGLVGIDQFGECLINYNIDGGLQINPAGNTLEFLPTSGSVVQGQIVGLSTINGVAYPPSASAGVSDLNALTGSFYITSADGSINIDATGTDIDLSVVKNTSVVVITPTANPEIIVPVSGTFYPIAPDATNNLVEFDMTGIPAGTTFTVKNISKTDDLLIKYNDGTAVFTAIGVNLPLKYSSGTANSVLCVCIWDGSVLKVY